MAEEIEHQRIFPGGRADVLKEYDDFGWYTQIEEHFQDMEDIQDRIMDESMSTLRAKKAQLELEMSQSLATWVELKWEEMMEEGEIIIEEEDKEPKLWLARHVGMNVVYNNLLKVCGIQHLFAMIYKHALTLIITTDGKVHWLDLGDSEVREIVDGDLDNVTVADIVDFANDDNLNRMDVLFKTSWFTVRNRKAPYNKELMIIYQPDAGEEVTISRNLAQYLEKLEFYHLASKLFEYGLTSDMDNDPETFERFLSDYNRMMRGQSW